MPLPRSLVAKQLPHLLTKTVTGFTDLPWRDYWFHLARIRAQNIIFFSGFLVSTSTNPCPENNIDTGFLISTSNNLCRKYITDSGYCLKIVAIFYEFSEEQMRRKRKLTSQPHYAVIQNVLKPNTPQHIASIFYDTIFTFNVFVIKL